MAVHQREYLHPESRRPAWGYYFSHEKIRYREAGFRTEAEAKDAEARKRKEVLFDKRRVVPTEKISVKDAVEKFLAYRKATRAPETVRNETRRFNVLNQTFGKLRLAGVTTGDIQRYVQHRATDGIANRTINLELTALRSLFKHAIENNLATENPAKNLKNLRETRTEKWIPSIAEFERFVQAAYDAGGKQLMAWLILRALTGVRPRESFFIEWSDCSFDRNQITIRPKEGNGLKNNRFRVVEIHPQLRDVLVAWRDDWNRFFGERRKDRSEEGLPPEEPHQWMFFHPLRPYRQARGFRKTFVKARAAAGVPLLTSHGLRHYFISRAVMDGVPLYTISKFVGHSSTKMIEETYGHLSPEYRAAQMAKIQIAEVPSWT